MQLSSVDRLERALALFMVVAWRVACLMRKGRTCPDLDARLFFDPDEIRGVHLLTKKKMPAAPPTLNEFVRLIALGTVRAQSAPIGGQQRSRYRRHPEWSVAAVRAAHLRTVRVAHGADLQRWRAQAALRLQPMAVDYGEARCQSLSGRALDDFMAAQVLRALQPAALEISLQAAADVGAERAQQSRHWQQRLERAHYGARRAPISGGRAGTSPGGTHP